MKLKFDAHPDDFVPPRPLITAGNAPYWEALEAGEVRLQRCDDCDRWIHYPRPRCPGCGSTSTHFEVVDAAATIVTFTVAHQPTAPHFHTAPGPQVIAVVELGNGVRITTTLETDDPDQLVVGLAVTPVFERGDDGIVLLRYQPAA